MIAHPPCTYLTNSANRWLYEACSKGTPEQRHVDREAAIEFFLHLKNAPIPRIAIENPKPHPYVLERVGRYQQKIQPWEFGEPFTKAACLWLKGLPPLMATIIETERTPACWLATPKPGRGKERSRTYQGISRSMAEQWG